MAVTDLTFNGIASILGLVGGERARARDTALGEIRVVESLLIDRPAPELYRLWRDFANLPNILTNLERVEVLDERSSRWRLRAPRPADTALTWEMEIVEDDLDERITWRARPGSGIEHEGMVRFEPTSRGTRMRAELRFQAPTGRTSVEIAKLLGQSPEAQIRADLRNFKRVMEVGEVPTIVGQPRGTCGIRREKRTE